MLTPPIQYDEAPHFKFTITTYGDADLSIHGFKASIPNEEALAMSIEKWKAIVRFKRENPRVFLNTDCVNTCPLCLKFYRHWEDNCCEDCPIYDFTGQQYCDGTPYKAPWDLTLADAEAEVAFLESLL